MEKHRFLYLSAEEVRAALPMKDAIDAMKQAFIQISDGTAMAPPRIHMEIEKHDTTALFMPVYLPGEDMLALKLVTLGGKNPGRGLPLIHAMVMVMDADTGRPVGMMDGASVTAIRTGAGAGLATDLMARKDSRVAAVFGAGVQGRTQLEAVCAVRPIEKAYVFDKFPESAEKFALEMAESLGISVEVAGSPEILLEADIICTATTSESAVFDHRHVKPGAHINAVGAFKPFMQEIPEETVAASRIVIDEKEGALTEAGDLIIALRNGIITEDALNLELGCIVSGSAKGRENNEEITFFKSVGNAAQDLAAASMAIKGAIKAGIGTMLDS